MKIIRIFVSVLFLCMMLTIGNDCSAQRTSVCDFTPDVFCENYNNLAKLYPDKSSILIDKASLIKKYIDANIGTLYSYPLRNCVNGNGTHVNLIVNQSNHIYEINITNNMNATKDDTGFAYMNVLKTLGVSGDDLRFFFDLSQPRYKSISKGRTLVAAFRQANSKVGFDEFKIAAFDN